MHYIVYSIQVKILRLLKYNDYTYSQLINLHYNHQYNYRIQ